MITLELAPVDGEKNTYALGVEGIVTLNGWARESGAMTVEGRTYELVREGFLRPRTVARPTSTMEDALTLARGELHDAASGRTFTWKHRLSLSAKWDLLEGEQRLARFEPHGWRQRDVTVSVEDGADVPATVLVFAAYAALVENRRNNGAAAGGVAAGSAAATG